VDFLSSRLTAAFEGSKGAHFRPVVETITL